MIQSIKNQWHAFEEKWNHKRWFKLLILSIKAIALLGIAAMLILAGFMAILSGNDSDSEDKKDGITSQDDRNADDIWKLTSGDDYYNQDPPDRFS